MVHARVCARVYECARMTVCACARVHENVSVKVCAYVRVGVTDTMFVRMSAM